MKKLVTFVLLLSLAIIELEAQSISGYYLTNSQMDSLKAIADREAKKYIIRKAQAVEWANKNGIPVTMEINGTYIEIQYIDEFGRPQYYKTDNANAAATISTNKVYSGGGAGLSLTGSGITVREWDGGSVLSTHQEFGDRVTVVDAVASNYHSTHVAGTIMASGVVAAAKGMAYQANLRSFDWNSDVSEMATEGLAGALISNHSYGYVRGWSGGVWYGNPAISTLEDYLFGFYDSNTQQWDQVAFNAPNFLICKSAGNDRGESGVGYPADGPYDCIGQQGVAKNILTVGAVDDIPGGYTTPSSVVMSSFSSWGPADDGRIKPDIVANGIGLYSTYNTSNTSYSSLSGTSMASPSVAGSLALLQQHYYNLKSNYLRSATLKAIVIHTADEAGPDIGPDYMFGWGLMNTKNAALKISEDQTKDVISELTLNNAATYTRSIVALGNEPLKVTLVWTDPAGTPPAASLDPITPMLVNDLDLRITSSGSTYYPWKLDRDNPANAATNTGENNVDNVEVVYIANPVAGATYNIIVDHDGTLSGGSQAYSIVISGISAVGTALVNTTVASAITLTTATSGGNVTADGGSPVTARGVCWATTADPVVTGSHTTNGSGTGLFTSSITGLVSATLYHIRAYATTANGTFYGDDLTFTTLGVITITTAEPTAITQNTVTSGGTATSDGGSAITARGVCWSTTADPVVTGSHTTDGSGTGTFTSSITGLLSNTIYHVRAYATNSIRTFYGADLTFRTLCTPIGLFTESFESTTFPPSCWSTSVISGTYNWTRTTVASGFGTGTASALANFFSQSAGTYELKSLPFDIAGLAHPTLKFNYAYATYSGEVDQMDVYYSTNSGSTYTLLLAMPGGTSGILNTGGTTTVSFIPTSAQWKYQTIPLPAGTNMVKFRAISAFGNNLYLDDVQLLDAVIPALATTAVTSISQTTAVSGGNITSDGGATVTARGTCWATTANPTIANSKTTDGTGTGSFVSNLTGLLANTTYHVRAYATNDAGTAYGNDITFTTSVLAVPTLTTTEVTSITLTTAVSGGNITADGGASVTARGTCWSTTANPTIANSKTIDGTGTGIFVSNLTALLPGTTYHVRAYATNSVGTGYGNDLTFTTIAVVVPTLTTTAVTSVNSTTALSGGNVTADGGGAVTARGVCWSTTTNPTIANSKTTDGTGTGTFTSTITGLTPGTTYHVRAYATNSAGTGYGTDIQFALGTVVIPTLTTNAVSSITMSTATCGGNITFDGYATVTSRGVCWSTTTNPTIASSKTTDGTGIGAFTSNITGLTPGTTYYVRAYGTNSAGTGYGSENTFTTLSEVYLMNNDPVTTCSGTFYDSGGPTGTYLTYENFTKVFTPATPGSKISFNFASFITESYFDYLYIYDGPNTSSTQFAGSPFAGTLSLGIITASSLNTSGAITFRFTSDGSINGTGWAATISCVGGAGLPTVSTDLVSSITQTTAVSGGNITSDGGAAITARGVCWALTADPTVVNSHTTDGTGTGSFISYLTGLLPGTTYHVRAYATNSAGTAYGTDIQFSTLPVTLPTLTTTAVTSITQTTAVSGGNITSDGGGAVTARGVCWATTANPTIANTKTSDGTGAGVFTSNITGLTPGTTYHVRAYATNSAGTAYGEDLNFQTYSTIHFTPVWWPGSGMDHMNLYALTATLDGTALQPGDEIGIFDGTICVGMGVLTQVLNGTIYLSMVASRDDPDTPLKDGYTTGNIITYRLWDLSAGSEVSNVVASYTSGEGIYAVGATSVFHLTGFTAITQNLSLTAGWNIMSFAAQPTNMSMLSIVNPLITAATLTKVQDERGNAIEQLPAPIGWVDNIGLMKVEEGYKIKVTTNSTLSVTGQQVILPYTITLSAGWNIMGYPSMSPRGALAAFNPLITAATLLKVQDEAGNAIEQLPAPIGWIDNIINLTSGHGYKVKTTINTSLVIDNTSKGEYQKSEAAIIRPTHFKLAYTGNGLDQMNIYIKKPTVGGVGLKTGDEIGVFDGGLCVGAVVVNDPNLEYFMVVASLDDPTTKWADGFTEGNNYELRLWDNQAGLERKAQQMEIEKGYNKTFEKLGTSVLAVDFETVTYTSLGDAFPNPSTDKTTFTFQLGKESKVRLEIFNMEGDLIKVLVDRNMAGGTHQIEWDNRSANGIRASSGVYFYKLQLINFTETKHLVIH